MGQPRELWLVAAETGAQKTEQASKLNNPGKILDRRGPRRGRTLACEARFRKGHVGIGRRYTMARLRACGPTDVAAIPGPTSWPVPFERAATNKTGGLSREWRFSRKLRNGRPVFYLALLSFGEPASQYTEPRARSRWPLKRPPLPPIFFGNPLAAEGVTCPRAKP